MNKIPIKITNKPTQSIKLTNLCPTDHIQKPVGEIAINSNGIFNVEKFASANVNVTPPLQNKKATENGTVVADDGYYGLGEVVVEVESEGESGVPIVVEELPTPTEEDVGKVYLLKNTKILPTIGEPIGDKIYFDTTKNPVDYVAYMDKCLIGISNGTNTYFLAMVDVLAAQGVTGYGHCYGLALATEDMSTILGIAYIYCDVLNVAQFNQMIGSQFGVSITEFGWQTNVLDISAVADYEVTYNYLDDWDNIAYLGTIDIDEVEGEYYIGKNSTLEVGTSLGNVIHFDTTQNPMDYIEGMTSMALVFVAANEDDTKGVMFMVGDALEGEGGDMGQAYMIAAMIYDEGSQQISCPYVYCNTLTVDEFNTNFGSMLGLSITEFGWQMDEMDTSAVADCVVKENYISEINNIAYGGISFEKIHGDEINELTAENTSLTTANETLTTEKTNLESQVSTLTSEKSNLQTQVSTLTTENSTLTSEKSNLQSQVSTLTTKNQTLTNQVSTLTTKNQTLTNRVSTLTTENQTLTNQVSTLETKYDNVMDGRPDAFDHVYDYSTSIRPYMYAGFGLRNVIVGENVTNIGNGAFYNNYLDNISLPSGLTSIGKCAFACCRWLTTITIPKGVTVLPYKCFSAYYLETPGVLVNMDLETVLFAEGSQLEIIGESCFEQCQKLTTIVLPESVTTIGSSAFNYCENLSSINIPEGVTKLNSAVFRGCSSLQNVKIPAGVTYISDYVFYHCDSLTDVTCNATTPPTLKSTAFSYCTALSAIYVPAESVEAYKTANGWSEYANLIQPIPQ